MRNGLFTLVLAVGLSPDPVGAQAVSQQGGAASTPLDFSDAAQVPTGISPYFAVAADFNSDGYLDLAASNTVGHSISVFLNQRNGAFTKGIEYPTHGFTPYAVAAGDLDGDGDVDLVCGNMFSLNYTLFFNKGDGTFAESVTQKAAAGPMFSVIIDLDKDGLLDLALCNIGHDDISVYFNRGGGKFEAGKTYQTKGVVPYSLVAADFNRDGNPDLATGNIYSSNVSVLKNLGKGSFADAETFATQSLTQIVFPADFNSDGWPDLVTGNGGSDTISVLINDTRGGFLPVVNYTVKLPQGVTAGDIDGDGDIDIATANQSANTTSVLLNRGDGTFLPAIDFQVQGLYPTSILMADLDRNGRLDLVTANSGSNNLSILYNAVRVPKVVETVPTSAASVAVQNGRLPHAIRLTFNTTMAVPDRSVLQLRGSQSGVHEIQVSRGPATGEIQIDPIDEPSGVAQRFFPGEHVTVALTSGASSSAGLHMKTGFEAGFDIAAVAGTGRFDRRETLGKAPLRTAAAVDLDRDGRLDLVALHDGAVTATVYFNDGPNRFQATHELDTGLLELGAMLAVDVDRDGLLDVVAVDMMLPRAAVLFNTGRRTFAAPVIVVLSPDETLSRPVALVAADWNGDGLLDIASANRLSDDITLAFNATGRTFRPAIRIPAGGKPVALAAADLDGNGVPDLVTVNTRTDAVNLYMNDGNGAFLRKDALPLLYGDPRELITTDLNGDGAVDLLVVDTTSTELVRFLNNGDGTFRRPDYVPVPVRPSHAAVADVNADGSVDLVVAHAQGVTLLQSTRDAGYMPASLEGAPADAVPLIGDFDGDGAIDLILATRSADGAGSLALFANGTRAADVR